jgi:hypothetical protein
MQRREPEYIIKSPEQIPLAVAWMQRMASTGLQSGKPVAVRVGRERRNLEMNAKMWAMLADISKQVQWYGKTLKPEDWKHIFSAACLNQRTVPGIDGGIVVLGQSTSKMTKRQFSDLIELMYSFGADNNVKWSDPTMSGMYPEYAR